MKLQLILGLFLGLFLSFNLHCKESDGHQNSTIEPSQEYDRDFIDLVEMIYGEGFLSQGGTESIDEMFRGINLDKLKILDLGSGLGAPDLYLAQHYNVDITGIDPQNIMIKEANKNLENIKKNLKGTVSFLLMEDPSNLNQFSDCSFDLIISKESILHVPLEIKEAYFNEIYRVLKPQGQIVILDWMHDAPNYSENTKRMMEMDGLVFALQTPNDYQNQLKKVGFKNIQFEDVTLQHAKISEVNIETIMSLEEKLKERFGDEIFNYSLQSWTFQRDAFLSHELIVGLFRALK